MRFESSVVPKVMMWSEMGSDELSVWIMDDRWSRKRAEALVSARYYHIASDFLGFRARPLWQNQECKEARQASRVDIAEAASFTEEAIYNWWLRSVLKLKLYLQTKSWWHISIQGWDITTSSLENLTSTVLEFYFQFWLWPHHHNQHVILHQPAKFYQNWSPVVQ